MKHLLIALLVSGTTMAFANPQTAGEKPTAKHTPKVTPIAKTKTYTKPAKSDRTATGTNNGKTEGGGVRDGKKATKEGSNATGGK